MIVVKIYCGRRAQMASILNSPCSGTLSPSRSISMSPTARLLAPAGTERAFAIRDAFSIPSPMVPRPEDRPLSRPPPCLHASMEAGGRRGPRRRVSSCDRHYPRSACSRLQRLEVEIVYAAGAASLPIDCPDTLVWLRSAPAIAFYPCSTLIRRSRGLSVTHDFQNRVFCLAHRSDRPFPVAVRALRQVRRGRSPITGHSPDGTRQDKHRRACGFSLWLQAPGSLGVSSTW